MDEFKMTNEVLPLIFIPITSILDAKYGAAGFVEKMTITTFNRYQFEWYWLIILIENQVHVNEINHDMSK